MIVIAKEELGDLGERDPWITWFDEHFPNGRAEFASLSELMMWAHSVEGAGHVRWYLLETGRLREVGADLSDADLAGCYFNEAELQFSKFSGADLSRASFDEAKLSGADFSRSNLRGASLKGCTLNAANFSNANLVGADLSGSYVVHTNFSGANLVSVNLCANLSVADFSDANLFGANLSLAILKGANLSNANLSGANLTNAIRSPTDPPIDGWEIYIDGLFTRLKRAS